MDELARLRRALPPHVAFNVALLLRGVRPVIQLDKSEDGEQAVRRFERWCRTKYPGMASIDHTLGVLLFFPSSPMPRTVREALGQMQSAARRDIKPQVGAALQLVCSARKMASPAAFRVMIGIRDTKGAEHYFKQQMCASAADITDVFRELRRYDALAQEMGMEAVTMKVVRRV